MPNTPQLSREVLEAALRGLESERDKVKRQLQELRSSLNGNRKARPAKTKRRRMSAAGRQRIADAAKKRWAAWRQEHEAGGTA